MSYQTKLISFDSEADRTQQFDHFMQVEMQGKDISLKDAIVSSDQALVIYEGKTNGDTRNTLH